MSEQLSKLDTNIIFNNIPHNAAYRVRYCVFQDIKDTKIRNPILSKKETTKLASKVCYSDLVRHGVLKKELNPKAIYTDSSLASRPNYPVMCDLTYNEQLFWLNTLKQYKMLPSSITANSLLRDNKTDTFAHTFRMIVKLNNVYLHQLYIYFVMLRCLRDDMGFVKAFIHLYKDGEMNFFAAFVLAAYAHITGIGHFIIPATKGIYSTYGKSPKSLKDAIDIQLMVNLQRFINTPDKYKDILISDLSGPSSWMCCDRIRGVSNKTSFHIKIPDLYNQHIINAIMSDNDGVFNTEINKYRKELGD